ncbi:MAG: glutamine--fructose-6-phosphate transaminase (isomerizing) [Verrucomicrobia bacterium]|nr:glutamine--fructose-6-phosphate transaminase (isomerizing) [Verrucomicrobiota bacterium]NDE62763.1 glutamine--fructose-6-phosphate transaminase (isomerizing) [Chlamydiota bacterium]
MCGIFGICGTISKSSVNQCIEGLKKLEYRGYDSSGIALLDEGGIQVVRSTGKVEALEKKLNHLKDKKTISIAHTRWATHGGVVEINAHPHLDEEGSLALVHNGIIENFYEIKERLQSEGVRFSSQTDTEVIAHLFGKLYTNDLLTTTSSVIQQLEGAFAIACIHKNHPDTLLVTTRDKPLIIAVEPQSGQILVASDLNALYEGEFEIFYLQDNQIALIEQNKIRLFNKDLIPLNPNFEPVKIENTPHFKGEFAHFMLKEIYEQPSAIRRTLEGRYDIELNRILLNLPKSFDEVSKKVQKVIFLGCGTSYHAGCITAHFLEEFVKIEAQAEIASEFRYSEPLINPDTLVIAISQSGETADTIGAIREAKNHRAKILSITNVANSSIIRESDYYLLTQAGPEISVCSTKAFTSQLTLLYLVTLYIYQIRNQGLSSHPNWLKALRMLPAQVESVLQKKGEIQGLAKKTVNFEKVLFIGRQYMYYTALESSLKLKEISYLFTLCYPAGELKHGPLALIDEKTLTIALLGHQPTFAKTCSNIQEVQARKGPVLALYNKSQHLEQIQPEYSFLIDQEILEPFKPILYAVVLQLYAYYIALEKETDIDYPKNLAKSVTVE